jgi:hypothetical protein
MELKSYAVCTAVLLALGTANCYRGPAVGSLAPAIGARGVAADLRLERAGRLRGELVAADDTALLVLRDDGRLVRVPISAVNVGLFATWDQLIEDGEARERGRARLRLMSRYPAGLRAELLGRLLESLNQSGVERVPPSP